MLHHHRTPPADPTRVVILGAGGFIGGAITARLGRERIATEALGHRDLDLVAPGADERLAGVLRDTDSLVVVSARAPCKNPAMLVENVIMIGAACEALARRSVAHLVYISSDAVYADGPLPLTEASPAAPTSLHGAMHLAREQMLAAAAAKTPFAILRPTLVYGARDPHGGYGPNRFRRLANRGEKIVLFGEGEERRDHVLVDDVAELARLVLRHRSSGILNCATGSVASFRAIAETVVKLSGKSAPIVGSPRSGPMPHNGYRPFDPAATYAAFPGFRYTTLEDGLARAQQEFA
jgi:UDP-glucose 4-epimerase